MQFSYYIAKTLSTSKQHSFTKTITLLATAAVSISIAVVILAFGILLGFKKEVRSKVRGYAGDISITRYQLADGSETNLFDIDTLFIQKAKEIAGTESVYPFIHKAGILKSDSTLEGIVFKGFPANYNFDFFKKHLKRGVLPNYTDSVDSYDILLSEYTAQILSLDTGDKVNLYIIDAGNVKRRKPKVVGIFNTGLQEFDKQFGIAHLRAIQRVVGTSYSIAGGYEIRTPAETNTLESQIKLSTLLDYNYAIKRVEELYPIMFQWLDIVDNNVLIIIILMLIVAIINVITVLLILIIDRIPMIGLLKSMGSTNGQTMKIFHWQGLFILLGGLILGNGVALGMAALQVNYKLIALPADTYYMDAVPFHLPFMHLVFINLGALAICFIFTYIPVQLVNKIKPSDSIRFR